MTDVTAKLRHARISPKKMRLVVDLIRGKSVPVAIRQLHVLQLKPAGIVLKTLQSAVANAKHNEGLSADQLFIKKIIVNQGVPLKRWKPAAHGSAHPFKKHASHLEITIALTDEARKKMAEARKIEKKVEKPESKEVTVEKTVPKKAAAAVSKPKKPTGVKKTALKVDKSK